jgi:hypothetical protein
MASLLIRPVVVPLTICAVGGYYGTYDIVSTLANVVLSNRPNKQMTAEGRFACFAPSAGASLALVFARAKFDPPPPPPEVASFQSATMVTYARQTMAAAMKFPLGYYASSIAASAAFAGVLSASLRKLWYPRGE